MATSDTVTDTDDRVVEEYVLDVRILHDETTDSYRFEAPEHTDIAFDSLEDARRYADVYFDVNGFVEDDTGERGVPPEIVQAGKDTLAVYLLTLPWADVHWVASFYGGTTTDIERYCSWVRDRADEIRSEVANRDLE